MAKNATPSLTVSALGDGLNITITPTAGQSPASPAAHQIITVSSSNVTVTPPTGTLYAIIVPPSGSALSKTLKGVAADTGVPLSLTNPSLIAFPASPGAFVVATSSGSENLDVYFF